jgi:hypothetical protein
MSTLASAPFYFVSLGLDEPSGPVGLEGNEDASHWLALIPGLDVFIEPLRRVSQRREAVSIATRDLNHRDYEKRKRTRLKDCPTCRTTGDGAD